MEFLPVINNLRDSFRILAAGRPVADVVELPGVSIASLGVAFQMFNAAFLSEAVESETGLAARIETAQKHFAARRIPWSFWFCEDWMPRRVRRKLAQVCFEYGLRLAAEMPGLTASGLEPGDSGLVFRRVDSLNSLAHFRAIGSTCFHVPITWFSEVFNDHLEHRRDFVCWAGYLNGVPVATAASVYSGGVTGIYNVGTLPAYRNRGYAEAITRHAADDACGPLVLQSTSAGLGIYERMGFRAVTRVLVYNSGFSK